MSGQAYRIYVKTSDMRHYGAIGGGGVVGNLIYASVWWSLDDASKAFDVITKNNPDMSWQIRDSSNNKVMADYKPA